MSSEEGESMRGEGTTTHQGHCICCMIKQVFDNLALVNNDLCGCTCCQQPSLELEQSSTSDPSLPPYTGAKRRYPLSTYAKPNQNRGIGGFPSPRPLSLPPGPNLSNKSESKVSRVIYFSKGRPAHRIETCCPISKAVGKC